MKICLILTGGLLLFFSTTTQQRQATAGGLPLVISNSGKQAPDHGGQIGSKYDGFAHETVATLRKMRVT
ncbi:MAG TPA: hypothetical protein DHU55_14085, partial [Blastocatellia bacterium]|nr:hypothetical protein [Blastocatellia bacterium]